MFFITQMQQSPIQVLDFNVLVNISKKKMKIHEAFHLKFTTLFNIYTCIYNYFELTLLVSWEKDLCFTFYPFESTDLKNSKKIKQNKYLLFVFGCLRHFVFMMYLEVLDQLHFSHWNLSSVVVHISISTCSTWFGSFRSKMIGKRISTVYKYLTFSKCY